MLTCLHVCDLVPAGCCTLEISGAETEESADAEKQQKAVDSVKACKDARKPAIYSLGDYTVEFP